MNGFTLALIQRSSKALWIRCITACVLAFAAHTASADPAVAQLQLQRIDIKRAVFDAQYALAKTAIRANQIAAARQALMATRVTALELDVQWRQLAIENQRTLADGQCIDCNEQQIAVHILQSIQLDSAVIGTLLQTASVYPGMPQTLMQLDVRLQIQQINYMRLQEAMIAAQQP